MYAVSQNYVFLSLSLLFFFFFQASSTDFSTNLSSYVISSDSFMNRILSFLSFIYILNFTFNFSLFISFPQAFDVLLQTSILCENYVKGIGDFKNEE